MYFATKFRQMQILVWLIWAIACLVFLIMPDQVVVSEGSVGGPPALAGVVAHDHPNGPVFPWQVGHRWRKWARQQYRALRRAQRRAVWLAHLAGLALTGALTLAQLVDWVTQAQVRRHLGALPVLYALLESLRVQEIINRYCPTKSEVDHGTVAMVLVLNRLMIPLPLYQVADWVAHTVLAYALGVPAAKFNDDRLGRTLDVITEHRQEIWQDIVHQAFVQGEIDLTLIFYDLTAFIVHGAYRDSQYADFGFAHNTPLDKRKFKVGLDVAADGSIPLDYELWSGRTADLATVQENMARLKRLLQQHGYSMTEVTVIGDRANLNDELALAYTDHNLRYLAGLQPQKRVHRELLVAVPEKQFYAHPLTEERGPTGYWGVSCAVPFASEGRQVTHQGLVVLSGPMRTARRQTRAAQLRELRQALTEVQAKIGQPRYRTVETVQKRADTKLRQSPVGQVMRAEAYTTEKGQVCLRWGVDSDSVRQAMQHDGRYLLVTNDWSLIPQRMLALYRQKDGVEKRFQVAKKDLKVSPVYLHKDERIEAMLLINMLALLTYSLLERQVRQGGVQMTTRRIIEKLQSLDVIETCCWDGSRLLRLVPVDEEQAALWQCLAHILADFRFPRWPHPLLPAGETPPSALPPPREWPIAA